VSDDELLKMLVETPPEEWNAEQIEALQARLSASPELRAALGEHLWLDQTLHHSLGRVQISADQIFARAQAEERSSRPRRTLLVTVVAALLVALGGVAYWRQLEPDAPPQVVEVKPSVVTPKSDDVPKEPPTSGEKPTLPGETPATPVMPDASKTAVVEKTVPIAPQPNEPWSASLAEAPVSFDQAALTLPTLDDDSVDPKLLARWFQPIRGQLQPFKDRKLVGIGLEGLAQLRAPLPAGAALRVVFHTKQPVRFHFWSGTEGATFECIDRNGGTWSTYRSTRPNNTQPTPQRLAMCGVDLDRYRRIGNGIVEFRHQAGQLVLSCGDVLIATVPLADPPQNIVVECEKRCVFGSLQLIRTTPFPLPEPRELPPIVEQQPRELPLVKNLSENAKVVENADGSITLSASDLKQSVSVKWPVANTGWSLLDFEVEGVTPGAGLFAIDEKSTGVLGVGVYQERKQQMPFIAISSPSDKNTESTHDPGRGGLPAIGERQWLRMIMRPYGGRVLAGIDGLNWGEFIPLRGYAAKRCDLVGLYLGPGKGARSITLRRFRAVPLIELPGLCPPEWREQMPDVSAVTSIAEWHQAVLAKQPAGIDTSRWRWACAAHAFVQGLPNVVLNSVVEVLVEAARSPDRDQAAALRLLDELALVSEPGDLRSFTQLQLAYEELATNAWRDGEKQPFSTLRSSLIGVPTSSSPGFDPLATPLTRLEVLEQIQTGGWDAIHRLSRIMRFFTREFPEPRRSVARESSMRLVDWAEALAQRNRPTADQTSGAMAIPTSWRHPLVEQLGKEGYNVLAELDSALNGAALKDACQIISSMTAEQAVGLLPNARDSELLVSLPNAVALAMKDHPDLARTMQSDFGQLAELRLRQAAVEADARVMQALTTQFHSTTAAAEAQVWLGDRALSTGDLRRAEAFYRAAIQGVSIQTQPALTARLRLVAAMNGRQEGEPVTSDVRLGDVDLPAASFERLVQESVRGANRNVIDDLSEPDTVPQLVSLPAPGVFDAVKTAMLEGTAGRDPASFGRRDLDQMGAQTAVVIAPPNLIVNSRFSIAAFSLDKGERVWQRTMDSEQGRTHSWPLVAMRPLVAGPVTFVRRIATWGPELVAIDTATGEQRWRSAKNEIVASDPLVLTGRVAAVTLQQVQQDVLQLMLTNYDPRSGKVVSQQSIVQLRDVWTREVPLSAQVVGDTVLIVGGGCVIGCDLEGNPRWLRRQTWLWGVSDIRTTPVRFDPPLIDEGRAIVTQPGVPSVSCVDIETGQLVWQRILPDNSKFCRLLGMGGDKVYLQVADQLLAYSRQTGEPIWRQVLPGMCESAAIDSAGHLLLAIGERSGTKQHSLKLVWLDGATGVIRDSSYVRSWSQEQPWFGPLAIHEGRLFAITGGEPVGTPVTRQLVELRPLADRPTDGVPLDLPTLQWGTTRAQPVFPTNFMGWTVLQSGGGDERPAAFRAVSDGRNNVFHGYSTAARPLHFAREFATPVKPGQSRKMRLKFETPVGTPAWKLEVFADDKTVHTFPADKQSPPTLYEVEIELPVGTRRAFVVLRHVGGGGTVSLWERLEVTE
jgi:outer membrane protein assembly factor BamB